ncbi:MAG TPA: methyltransferase domain-containing protein [Vicinamibacterales bacterium]|nr:methyltransferase domain-containing protein [Vicinamibacterales bacterium]
MAALEARCLADLEFSEVSRALRALSSAYVERRAVLAASSRGGPLAGEGKRAAFALFYGPLHFLLVDHVVRAAPAARDVAGIIDLGCGTGAAGAAWACACRQRPSIVGIDKHPWAVERSKETYRAFGLDARVRRDDVSRPLSLRGQAASPAGIVAAFTVNELPDDSRAALLTGLVDRARRGDRILIVEPLARGVTPWWGEWTAAFAAVGGRADEWRVRVVLPPIVAKLDRAAGLDHRELTGRSIMTP